ncbi:YdcF family protein [Caldicellulosiruptor naganoensis]|uniref:YdcF family protein n=1 Tax=Caldicellulosiruptor naganoensis TaxID=29324 RepID=A0ABY7BEH0_9FIRM|nr:YdcF family protein [Caldicellulosiruptor naganoensis]WAM30757.1 YdcF family protein [Caldicellulosiruptor naganoensis]
MKQILKSLGILIGGIIIAFTILELIIIFFGVNSKPKKSDAIIVLGCAVYGDFPSPFFKARLDEALRLYNKGYGRYIIVSGGKGLGENISEAEAGKEYLSARGVPSEFILIENKSFSTYENLLFSKKLMNKYSLKSAVIVSNKFHLKRASIIAKKVGIKASFSGVYVGQYLYEEVHGFLREVPAVLYTYFIYLRQ